MRASQWLLWVTLGVMLCSASSAHAQPVIGPELGVGIPLLGPSPDTQRWPVLGWDGTHWVVAWSDNRRGSEVYTTRVSFDLSSVETPYGIAVDSIEFDHTVIACGPGHCMLGYLRIDNAYVAMRLVAGLPIDSPALTVGPAVTSWTAAGVINGLTWSGQRYYFVTEGAGSAIDVYPVETTGIVGAPLPIVNGANAPYVPRIACGATLCLVMYGEHKVSFAADIKAKRLLLDGTVLDPTPFLIATNANPNYIEPVVAPTLDGFTTMFSMGNNAYAVRRLLLDAGFADPAPVVISTADQLDFHTATCSFPNDTLVASSGATVDDIQGNSVPASGAIGPGWNLDSAPPSGRFSQRTFAMACSDAGTIAMAYEHQQDIYIAALTGTPLKLSTPVAVSLAGSSQAPEALGLAAGAPLLVWKERTDAGVRSFRAAPLSSTGVAATGIHDVGVLNSGLAWNDDNLAPTPLACANSVCVVTYSDWTADDGGTTRLNIFRMDLEGRPLDQQPRVVSTAALSYVARSVAVRFGNRIAVLWAAREDFVDAYLLNADGTENGTSFVVAPKPPTDILRFEGATGSAFGMLVNVDGNLTGAPDNASGDPAMSLVRVSLDSGTVIGTYWRNVSERFFSAFLGTASGRFFIMNTRGGSTTGRVLVRVFQLDGGIDLPVTVKTGMNANITPRLGSDGTELLLLYHQNVDGGLMLKGQRFAEDLSSLDVPFDVGLVDPLAESLRVTGVSAGRYLVTTSFYSGASQSRRLIARWIDFGFDAGVLLVDAGADAGVADAGTDAGFSVDAGADGGSGVVGDAGAVDDDGGAIVDAGLPDSRAPDASTADDGGLSVKGSNDSDAMVAAGDDGGTRSTASSLRLGCDCGAFPNAPLIVLGLCLMAWRAAMRQK